ncbi:MAG TPA: alpha/beta hydrolase [Candidatus Binatia bacterium]|jgi:pimeloyl-ACP methyl ester carboxylesterase
MPKTTAQVKAVLETDRFLIPYRIFENDAPHVVCVNGVQQSMAMWQTFIARFSHRYRIVLFDFPNQGRAKILSGAEEISLNEQIGILDAVLDETATCAEATLCAASWGGVVAAAFAAAHPLRIKRMVLASLGTKPSRKLVDTIEQGATVDMKNPEKVAEVLIQSFGEDLPSSIKQKIASQFRTMTEERVRAFYEHGLFVISSKSLSEVVDLKSIRAKTVLLNGEKDAIIDLDDVKLLASQIPDCEMVVVKGVGHFLHLEDAGVLDIYETILASGAACP